MSNQSAGLSLVLEFHLADDNRIAVLDAHFFQLVKDARAAQAAVEILAGLVVIKVDGREQTVNPLALYDIVLVHAAVRDGLLRNRLVHRLRHEFLR